MVISGMEVPFLSNDSLNWIKASVPRSVDFNTADTAAPSTQDYASYSVIDSPSTYLIWRICKSQPNAIEILEVLADGEVPSVGLRIHFPETLSPFAYICKNKTPSAHGITYLLYALTISGAAYLLQLKNTSAYVSSYVFQPRHEFLHFDTKISPDCPLITATAAATDGLVVARNDGSLTYYRLGNWYDDAPVLIHELRKATVGCLGNSSSSGSLEKSAKELVISKINGRNLLFVLHSNLHLRIWDLSACVKLLSKSLEHLGVFPEAVSRLSVGVADAQAHLVPLVFLRRYSWPFEPKYSIIVFHLSLGGRRGEILALSKEEKFDLYKVEPIDMKLSSNKLWILQKDALLEFDLCPCHKPLHRYSLQEAFISKQLFQDCEHSFDALYQITFSIFSSKEKMIGFISSIFVHRLLQPGVHSSSVLRFTLKYYNKLWTDHDFQALTIHEQRREILSLIQHEAINRSPLSTFECWKNFCSQYINHWCQRSAPLALLVDSHSGAVGLIRKNNVSLFRSLGDSEVLMYGTNFEALTERYNFDAPASDDLEREILLKVLDCIKILKQLCPAISSVIYELVGGALLKSTEDEVPLLFKAMQCGYNTSRLNVLEALGADFVWQKGLGDHKIGLSEFSFSMLQSVKGLRKKAKGWDRVLNILKRYFSFLVPQKLKPNMQNLDSDMAIYNIKIPIIVQALSQVAGLMLESAFDIFLFLSYLLVISNQVDMLPDDISRIQFELIPMVNDIIAEWLIIHLFSIMPSDSPSVEDILSSQLSRLRIDENSKQRSWIKKHGSIDFTLAFVLLLDAHEGCSFWSFSSLPNPRSFINLVRHFINLMYRTSGEKRLYGIEHTTELTLSLLRNGQYSAVEILLMIVEAHSRCNKLFGNYAHNECDLLRHLLECCLFAKPKVEHVDLPKIMKYISSVTHAGQEQEHSGFGLDQHIEDMSGENFDLVM